MVVNNRLVRPAIFLGGNAALGGFWPLKFQWLFEVGKNVSCHPGGDDCILGGGGRSNIPGSSKYVKISLPFHPKKAHQNRQTLYTPVIKHSNGILSPCLIGNTSSKGPFSIAMLDYRSVHI